MFIPWYGENSTTKNPDDADKIYHWNANGGTTTWQVPDNWKNLKAADVYQLSGDNKVKVAIVAITNGEIIARPGIPRNITTRTRATSSSTRLRRKRLTIWR